MRAGPNINAILDEIAPLGEKPKFAKILIYGPSGVGKTVLAAGAFDHPLFVDSLEGWVSIDNHPELEGKIEWLQYRGVSQLELLAANWDQHFADRFDGLILDEATSMATMDLDVVLAARSAKQSEKDPDVPTQPDFFANTERMRRCFRRILNLPVDVIFVAHDRKDEDAGRKLVSPGFSPKLSTTIKEFMHLVGYLTVIDKGAVAVRRLQVTPTIKVDAKTRIGGLPNVVTDPDLKLILSNWRNKGGRLLDPVSELMLNQPPVEPEVDNSNPDLEI